MWLLSFLPHWIFYAIYLVGLLLFVATFVLRFVPIIYMKRTAIQFVAIAVMTIGAFISGAIFTENKWQARVKEMEAKIAIAEAEAAKKNTEILEKIVYRDRVIREKGNEVIKYVDKIIVEKEEIVKYIENCPLPKEFVEAHNDAVQIGKK
jgi:acyl-coenzyme A synthetase/AMP-(fatty) acid ligase